MASTIKVDNVQNQPGTNIINKCSVTTTIGAGAGETINVCGATVNIGRCGGTVALASGATQSGFGRTGTVDWNTTKITADPANAVSGTGYFCDTSGGAFTVTLPTSPTAGDIVAVSDYAKTFDTYNLTLGRNGSNIGGGALDSIISTEGVAVTLVYVDATKGWVVTDSGLASDAPLPTFIVATGGTPCAGTTSGDYKIHTFTGPGTFTVCSVGSIAANNAVDYLVIAGGGGAGFGQACFQSGGGGGAGGYREAKTGASGCYTTSPLANPTGITVTATGFPIVVGGGGAGAPPGPVAPPGTQGNASSFSTIPSAGGGYGSGMGCPAAAPGGPGGSGGGGGTINLPSGPGTCGGAGGPGDDPATPIAQGTDGGLGESNVFSPTGSSHGAGGGGGATAAGGAGSPSGGGTGGAGGTSSINATPTGRGGGGGGGQYNPTGGGTATDGGAPGAGPAPARANGPNAPDNKGGGGGGGAVGNDPGNHASGGNGGSGIVLIRYRYQ